MSPSTKQPIARRTSVEELERLALREFPEYRAEIEAFIDEIAAAMALHLGRGGAAADGDEELAARQLALDQAEQTCTATGDDEVTLLVKFEDYLEALMMGKLARQVLR